MRKILHSLSKKNLVLFVFIFFSLLKLNAQTDITIGTGTTGNTGTGFPTPLIDYYEGSRMQFLYRASELTAKGMTAGNITQIKYNVTALNGAGVIEDYVIKIGTTSVTTLSTSEWDSFNGSTSTTAVLDYQPVTGVNTFTFTTPFFWNGVDNILIEICHGDPANGSGTFYTNNPTVQWTTSIGFNGSHTYRADGDGNLCGTSTATNTGTQTTRPNVTFSWSPASACTGTPDAGTATSSAANVCSGESFNLISNGTTAATGLTYQWQKSTDNATWTDIAGATSTGYNTTQSTNTYYRLKVSCGANDAFSNTVQVTTPAMVSGTFTINNAIPTGGSNFNSFSDAYNYIKCGINGPVVFNVVNGTTPYNEQLIMQEIAGTSATNTITFNCNGATLTYQPTISNERAIIKLNGTDHVKIDNLNIEATGTTGYGFGVQLLNNADFNAISNSTININTTSTSSNFTGISVSASETSATTTGNTLSDNNTFSNNTITGGYYGITLTGNTTTTTLIVNNKIIGNKIYDFYSTGIYVEGTDKSIIEGNDIKRSTRTSSPTTSYGIYFTGLSTSASVSKNRIHNFFDADVTTTDDFSGIYFTSSDATSGKENVVSNNLIYDIKSNGELTGLENSSSNFVLYYHNTISFDDQSSASTEDTRGIYQTLTASGISYKNNIITITRGGMGEKHIIYMNTAATTYTSDYNDFYILPSTENFIGRSGGINYATPAEWRTATSKDANSLSIDPVYQNTPGENYTPTVAALDNKGTPVGITADIENKVRSTTTPDMGAYEFKIDVCTAPPTAGNVVLNVTGNVCPNTTINFNLENNSLGIGQTYQWESATSLTGPWTAMSGVLTSPPFDHTVGTETLYYRAAVTCSGTTSYTTPVQIVVNPLFPGGTYTINNTQPTGGTNFNSFNDAYNAMRCGISGAVVFNVVAGTGPYNEQLIMDAIQGTSATNTITFNGNGNTITYKSTSDGERAVVKLNGTDYVTFDNIKITATGTGTSEYGFGVQIMNDADFNTISNSVITIDSTTSSSNYAGLVISNSPTSATTSGETQSDNNTFSNNTITGGYYGITLVGSSTLANQNNKIINNLVQEFYIYGIYVHGSFNTLIEGNKITRPARTTVSTFNGIYFTGLSTKANVTRNIITNPFGGNVNSTSTFNGIYFSGVDAFSNLENIVSNNLIYGLNGSGDFNGIYNSGSDNIWYYHNTISIDGNATEVDDKRGFYQTTSAGGIEFKNNIISITQTGNSNRTAIYFNTAASTIISNYNNLYLGTVDGVNNIGYYNSVEYPILINWQTGTAQDLNSVSNNPVFENPATGNFKPTNAVMDNLGTPVGITVDILGAARSATTPDMGAYEFAPPVCVSPPTAGTATVSASPVCENTLVQLGATGYSTGVGQTYQWQASASENGSYANISGLLNNPSFNITATSTFYYRLAVTCSGNTQYSTPVLLNVNPGLPGGVYTIDATQPATATNFLSFNEAKAAMSCGITGPITFEVAPNSGPYLEQLVLDSIPGTSVDNTITFNGNGNTIQFSSTTSAERAVIKLNGADHITFDSLIIDATGSGSYGWGVHLTNNADSNTFRRNTILTNTTSTSTTAYGGIIISSSNTSMSTGSAMSDGNTIDKNRINGGYYGITVVGSATDLIKNNSITNNNVEDFYTYGIFIDNTDNTLVEGNTVSRPNRTSVSTFNGIYINDANNNLRISKNVITNPFGGNTASTSAAYPIYFSGADGVAGKENKVVNNIIYNINGNGIIYALYNSGSDYVQYYHNTISLDNTASTSTSATRGFYQTTSAEGIEFKNNIVTISRGGSGAKHAIYMATTGTTYNSDYNDFFVAPGGNHYIGRNGTADIATLAAWRTATGKDANSVSIDPMYTNLAAGNLTPMQGVIDDIGTPVGVTTDILGVVRSSTTPDIGAYEFAIKPCTEPPTAGTAVATPGSGICLGTTIRLALNGNSTGGFQKYVWQIASSAAGPWRNISDTLFSADFDYELVTVDAFFRASVTCGSSTAFSTPVEIMINPALIAGDYTIDPSTATGGTNFQSFAAAVQALECGITGSVRFHVVPGTYNEQIHINKVPGASATSTVTFMSQNGNASSATLTYNATEAANYILKLDSTNFITFKNLSFTAVNPEFGRAIEIAGTSSNDSLLNNIITVPESASTTNAIAGIYGTSLRGTDIVVKGNTIINGSSSIYLSGTAGAAKRYVIEGNTVSGSYYYGIYASGINNINVKANNVTRSGILNTSAYGIYISNCDTAYQINNNNVNINGTGTTVYGIYLTGNQTSNSDRGSVSNNKIIADNNNTGNQYGLYVSSSTNNNSLNNVISVNTTGSTSYGIYSSGTGGINYLNNSVQSAATSNTNIAAYFSQTSSSNGASHIRNNIFSHLGGGRAMYIVNPMHIYSDYNMFYTTGTTLIQWGSANNFATLQQWSDTAYWDYNSIVYKPAFTGSDLLPDVANPEVWAMHGRGEQIAESNFDFNNNARPTTLTAGVPDLGAYEFVPTSTPVLLTATPATPLPNTVQTFMLGTDTVAKITWGATVPTTIEGRRFSGAIPPGLATAQKHMYFYTDFDITGATPTGYKIEQFYLDPWHGFIDNELTIKLGRTDASNNWVVSSTSSVHVLNNTITESGLNFIDKFTGLTDGNMADLPPIVVSPSDSANRGKNFWVGYGHHQDFGGGNAQEMVLYLGTASAPANVTVAINGTGWSKTYTIPANTVIASDFIPKYGAMDARLLEEGLSAKGISISSDVPITAYAHIYGNTNSGATMLMPIGAYGFEYYALTAKQYYAANTYSWFYVVAPYDSTVVEITPSKPTLGGRAAGVPFRVTLNKGEVYQVMGAIISGTDGYDMTGSIVKSVANVNGKCYPVAMFSGSSRTNIGCGTSRPTASGDNIIQQNFPYRAWGRKYLTAPTSASTAAATLHNNIYKVAVKDPATKVKLNGVELTNLIDNLYYQYESNTADYIESDKPVMVAQFIPSQGGNTACGNTGNLDPEMIYISPMEQGIKSVALYRNTEYNITAQYLTLVIPTEGVTSLLIDGTNTYDHSYVHPNMPGYSVIIKRWEPTNGQTFVQSDSAFTAITYGLGSAESYGYNAGTLIKNLNVFPSIVNVYNTATATNDYTCAETPFKASFLSTVQPQIIEWNFSQVAELAPNANVIQNNPTPESSIEINGVTYYKYTLSQQFTINKPGLFNVPIFITHPDVEGCNNRMEISLAINVLEAPKPDFVNTVAYCIGNTVQFNGTGTTANGTPIKSWAWDFDDNGTTSAIQNPSHTFNTAGTYDVKLSIISNDGCIGDTIKPVQINVGPAVTLTPATIGACVGDNVTFNVQNPVQGVVYRWYNALTGGTLVHTGSSFTTNVTGATSYYVESDLGGCLSVARQRAEITVLPALAAPTIVVDSVGANTVRFRWNAIPGATGYEVSVNGGTTWSTPSSGATGTTHTISNMQIGQTVTAMVRVIGGCLPATSQQVSATTITEQIYIPNSFTPNGDGLNDVLQVYGNFIKSMKFMVFNQWGEKIADSNTPQRAWDGTYKGKQQPSGVYMYVCEIILTDGTTIQRKGSINLIR